MTFTSRSPVSLSDYQIFMIGITHFTLQSIGKNEYGKTGHSKSFYFFEALLDYFEAQFLLRYTTDTDNT